MAVDEAPGGEPEPRIPLTPELLEQPVVILLQGLNIWGSRVFSYVRMTLFQLQELKDSMDGGASFNPAAFGEVLAAGQGDPSPELRREMAEKHNLVDLPGGTEAAGAMGRPPALPTFKIEDVDFPPSAPPRP